MASCAPHRRRAIVALLALALASVPLAAARADARRGSHISYRTFFQDPGAQPGEDHSLENHAVELIGATPAGEHITFAFRDFNSNPIVDALIAAHLRGALVDGVIDGGEKSRPPVQRLLAALGPDRLVLCGTPTFEFNSCIANSLKPSLQHNKFLTFSALADGRRDVVLQTSENFFGPSQFSYYNDMVEIAGDHRLHDGYVAYLLAMKAQLRSDDHYVVVSGDDGRNTMFPSPRRQADPRSDDTIVDRMDEIDCSHGGRIRVANMAFRSERAVIMDKLIELQRSGCDIDVVLTNADGSILAGLTAAGVSVHPFFLRRLEGTRPQVIVHDKFWLVDARSTVTGKRQKLTYAGSSNWRADQQYSDDMLLRIADRDVYAAYSDYWALIRSRVASDQLLPTAKDTVAPSSALSASDGRHRSPVTVRIAASDGHNVTELSGLKQLHVELSGAQSGTWDFPGEESGISLHELPITAEGETTISYQAEDNAGNLEPVHTHTVCVDRRHRACRCREMTVG